MVSQPRSSPDSITYQYSVTVGKSLHLSLSFLFVKWLHELNEIIYVKVFLNYIIMRVCIGIILSDY